MPILEEDRPSNEDYDLIRAQSESITKIRTLKKNSRNRKAHLTHLIRMNSIVPKQKEFKKSSGKLNDKLNEQLELNTTSKI